MVKKYAREPAVASKCVKTSGNELRVHYKNTINAANVLKGMKLKYAQKYLQQVLDHQRCVPIRLHNGHVGRTGQATEWGITQGRWPTKSCKVLLGLLQNLEANANVKQLNIDKLVIRHVQVNRAQHGRRRTYRAHGRITPYMSSPCHVEMFAEEEATQVSAEKKTQGDKRQALTRRQIARKRLAIGDSK